MTKTSSVIALIGAIVLSLSVISSASAEEYQIALERVPTRITHARAPRTYFSRVKLSAWQAWKRKDVSTVLDETEKAWDNFYAKYPQYSQPRQYAYRLPSGKIYYTNTPRRVFSERTTCTASKCTFLKMRDDYLKYQYGRVRRVN